MIRSITQKKGGAFTVRFGTNDVRRYTQDFPCRVWRVGKRSDGTLHYRDDRRSLKSTTLDRKVREAASGMCTAYVREWVEIRPDDWRPDVPLDV